MIRPVVLPGSSTFTNNGPNPLLLFPVVVSSRGHCVATLPFAANIWSLCVSTAADVDDLISDVQVHLDVRFLLLFSHKRLQTGETQC